MPASDYMVGNAPAGASYAAPLVGFQLGQAISQLPDQYMKGRENARAIEAQDMFRQGGMPTNPDGSPDIHAIVDKGAKTGGLPWVQQMMPFLQKMTLAQQAYRDMMGQPPGPQQDTPPPGRGNVSNAVGPGNLASPQNTAPQAPPSRQPPGAPSQPRLSSFGADNEGADTIRSMATEFAGGRDAIPVISAVARRLRINPDAPLDAAGVKSVRDALGQPPTQSPGRAPPQPGEVRVAPEAEDGAPREEGRAPFMASRGERQESALAPPARPGSRPQQQESQERRGLPPGYTEEAAKNLETLANTRRARAAQLALFGDHEAAAIFEKDAEARDARAAKIREAIAAEHASTPEQKNSRDAGVLGFENAKAQGQTEAKNQAITEEMKNAKATGQTPLEYERSKEVDKADIEQSKKKYDGLQNLAQSSTVSNQKLERIRSVMSDPNFMSGAGNSLALAWKQWNATLGGDARAAQPMEEFNKTAKQLLTDEIKAMGGSGVGQVRVAEVNIMKEATANLGISAATNRYLVEEAYRVHSDNIAVAKLAQQYKSQRGYLDAGWDAVRDKYYEEHPLFSKEELADPRLVSPPMLPVAMAADPVKRAAWERQQGLKPGDPIRTEDGRIRWMR